MAITDMAAIDQNHRRSLEEAFPGELFVYPAGTHDTNEVDISRVL